MNRIFLGAALAALLAVPGARAEDHAIGEPVEKNGLEVAAVYIQAVTMEPHHAHHDDTDIHLEADIKGLKGNANGYNEGEWVPYLGIEYTLTKQDSTFQKSGTLVPMVASDGPHYGDNIKMDGPGKYHVVYKVTPAAHGFMRHTDKESGVAAWWEPFTLEWDFAFVGVGKKGAY